MTGGIRKRAVAALALLVVPIAVPLAVYFATTEEGDANIGWAIMSGIGVIVGVGLAVAYLRGQGTT